MRERRRAIAFVVIVLAIAALPVLGKGPLLVAVILACALLGVPLFALIGIVAITCFFLWSAEKDNIHDLTVLVERIRALADNENLLAVPLFMLSGSIMSRGEISKRLIEFSKALIGWLPGGMALSGVVACMLFAAISGSSPATVVAIGASMGPFLIKHGYSERFSHGLLTSSGSLGILIPPSIPMIVYPLVYSSGGIDTWRLFASGFGPGFVIGGILGGACIYHGIRTRTQRDRFELGKLRSAFLDGFWSLLFPIVILGGLSAGLFTVVEASGMSVVYALAVEMGVHRALGVRELPGILNETALILGALLVIMVMALAFSEFIEGEGIPRAAADWIRGAHLSPLLFLLIVNLLFLVVGCLMDILSAMFIFIPLLAPIATTMGIDPIHFAIIFIVNLEIGYLTPPVGLNLFVASTLFNRPIGHIIRSVLPFICLMLVGLVVITYFPAISIGLGSWIVGTEETAAPTPPPEQVAETPGETERREPERVQTLEEMMAESEREDAGVRNELTPQERANPGRVLNMEEMMEAAESN